MKFESVGINKQHLVDKSVESEFAVRAFSAKLLESLKTWFDAPGNQLTYGVNLLVDDRLNSKISTPFGDARGRLTVQLVGEEIQGRYVFEKSVVSEIGNAIWVSVWAFSTTKFGTVLLGDDGSVQIDADASAPAIKAVARSLLYSIGVTPVFK